MVKGVTRQVVMVRSPDPKLFEQAIFLLRENCGPEAPSQQEILRQAQEVADAYILRSTPRGRMKTALRPVLYALSGAIVASGCWVLALYL